MQQPPEPPFEATPLVKCGPGSHQQPGIDGRVPAGSAKDGLNCNATMIGHQGTEGGFKTLRYIDKAGHECAFYDTTLLFPLNALNPGAIYFGESQYVCTDEPDYHRYNNVSWRPMSVGALEGGGYQLPFTGPTVQQRHRRALAL